jgi:Arc/MetJ-type ribon-helix-helix transcriptional regulator
MVAPAELVAALAQARIGSTFNQYAEGPRAPLLRRRLCAYLEARAGARILLVGEAPGYRGARVSGIPFTSERQLTGSGPAEPTATIVHRVLEELGLEDDMLLWRTQIYLEDRDREVLERISKASGASISELIRRAIRDRYGRPLTREERLEALRAAAGSWADRDFTGAEYVDAMRGDLNERLRRLGLG